MQRLLTGLAALAIAVFAAACGQASGAQPPDGASVDPNAATIVASGMAFGAAPSVRVGADFSLVFDNRDAAPHNVVIASDEGFANVVFHGDIVTASSITYRA